MEYISAREAADKWGISQRRVAVVDSEQRVAETVMVENMRIIPTNAEKPTHAKHLRYSRSEGQVVKPFLKWAGGKGQLLKEIEQYYPFENEKITKYAEPFVGGGAVLFDILSKYDLKEFYISDVNAELINAYCIIRDSVDDLVEMLYAMQSDFIPLDAEHRKVYYLDKRSRFNELKEDGDKSINLEKAALMIFLNKTCFNGLYRVNKKGLFNVPMGAYKNPLICDENNLRAVSEKLQRVTIVCGDYRESADFIDENTFVYFDPPYRPLTYTANFTAYTENLFNDEEQIQLANFADDMRSKGARIVISNSDPKNYNTDDDFFDNIYSSYKIRRVEATRMINCNSEARGRIKELLISNFSRRIDMSNRDFNTWLSGFRDSIADYGYYIDFEKIHRNVDDIKVELNILNSLIGSKNIETDFENLISKYPEVLRCIPLLLAVRANEIYAIDSDGEFTYNFKKINLSVEQYKVFMRKTGLFDLIENHIVNNLVDYATGVETGLDSNGRKNRGGHLMENLVEGFIKKAGFIKDETYFKEMYIHQITEKWNIDLSAISNQGKTEKRFDFVIKTQNMIYGIETNFYGSSGSKLNETARSYKTLASETDTIDGFTFVWFTDGKGWTSARHNLEETFDVMEHIYNINDMENGIIPEVFK